MDNNLISSFDPFEKPYAGMDMDGEAQTAIEQRDPPEVDDCDAVEHGRKTIAHFANPTEKGVLQQLKLAGLSIDQIERNFAAILYAAGPRFAHILGGLRQTEMH